MPPVQQMSSPVHKKSVIGLMSDGSESDGGGDSDNEDRGKKKFREEKECLALVNQPALRRPGRDAIRNVMLAKDFRVIFVILQITTETLSGRTLGAENPELAERLMKEKVRTSENQRKKKQMSLWWILCKMLML